MKIELNKHEEEIRDQILGKLKRHYGRTLEDATKSQIYKSVALTLRDSIMDKWTVHRQKQRIEKAKELYYLSFEFLMGRSLANNLLNMAMTEEYSIVLRSLGIDIDEVEETETDAGLGNGGLGRLAACFMDSLTTLDLPAFGCSIRYEYGLFKQKIIDGYQVEMPDPWLEDGTIWEIARPEEQQNVRFGGEVISGYDEDGKVAISYSAETNITGIPYDVPVTGYQSKIINTLRLWSAKSPKNMDMGLFSGGDYLKAIEDQALAEVLSKVLYPEDNHPEGKALRLRQQYFFVSCTVQWIIKRFKKYHDNIMDLPQFVVIHINDTHPAIAIPELMRILMDEEGLRWDDAWFICTKVFAYTNHTIMSEAIEKWPQEMFKRQLPRIWMIVDEMNNRLVSRLRGIYGDDWGKINYMSIVAHNYISMANICLEACIAINGVSSLHTEILEKEVFSDYYNLNPLIFHSITNGITYRRWIKLANPQLAQLIQSKIGDEWLKTPAAMKRLEQFCDDEDFKKQFAQTRQHNKERLCNYILNAQGIKLDPNSIFDVQVKRLHEYKRQLLNVLHILYIYDKIKNEGLDIHPRTFIFGAKASPGYQRAKLIIKLINSVAKLINDDPVVSKKIKVVFIENYSVSLAQLIMPAADVSEQISTAGKEASGTGNMKFMLNGALTVGTLDGANVEMFDLVGSDNIFIFGMTADEIKKVRQYNNPSSHQIYTTNPEVKKVLDMLIDGTVEPQNPLAFSDLYNSLLFGQMGNADEYMVVRDFTSYIKVQEKVEEEYKNQSLWLRKAIYNVANAGFFSSDRTVIEYNEKIWKLKKV